MLLKLPVKLTALSAFALLTAVGLSACGTSYVVLLAEEDGSLGQVSVTTDQGTSLLTENLDGVATTGKPGQVFKVNEQQIKTDFAEALSAKPEKPVTFVLYFKGGTAELTPDSANDIAKIVAEIRRRPVADVSIIGHTDTVGDERLNTRLSLKRAQSVARLFDKIMPDADRLIIDSHGESNLLVPTPDNTNEPRNRRVEVTVR